MLQIYKNKVNNSLYCILLTICPPFFNMANQKLCNARRCPVKKAHFPPFCKPLIINQMCFCCRSEVIKTARSIQFFEVPQALKWRPLWPRLPETSGGNAGWKQQKRRFQETNPMELLNESIGIVERNQWNRWTNPMDSFTKTGGFVCWNWQTDGSKTAENMGKGFGKPAALREYAWIDM